MWWTKSFGGVVSVKVQHKMNSRRIITQRFDSPQLRMYFIASLNLFYSLYRMGLFSSG